VFCASQSHDQLASLGRHAQLTRCFSAVAELLVLNYMTNPKTVTARLHAKNIFTLGKLAYFLSTMGLEIQTKCYIKGMGIQLNT